MFRFLRYTIEYIAAFVGFMILLVLLVAWRLSTHPISSDFLTPYIEEGVESLVPGTDVHIQSTLLTWDNLDRSVSLHIENIKIINADTVEIAEIPSLDARISVIGLLFGQFLPKYMAINRPQIDIERTAGGGFVFGGMAVGPGNAPAKSQPQPLRDVLRHIFENLSHAALMHKLSVTDATIDVHDEVTQKDWALNVPEISISRKLIGEAGHRLDYGALDGHIGVDVSQRDATARLDMHYGYEPGKPQHTVTVTFAGLNPSYLAGGHPESLGLAQAAIVQLPLTGSVELTLDKNFDIMTAAAQIHGDKGQLNYADFWDAPCPVVSLDLRAAYDRDLKKIAISKTSIDFGGPVLSIDADTDAAAATAASPNLPYTLALQVDNLPMNDYAAIWPKPILPDPRYWLAANLRDGMFTHANVTLKGTVNPADPENMTIDEGGGKAAATGGTVTYLDGMPPATGVAAEATFDLKQMSVQVTAGGVGAIRLQPFTLQVNGLAEPTQSVDVPMQVAGPIPDILRLLDHQPLGYAKKLGIAPDDIGGTVQGQVHFKFPLLKTLDMKDLDIKATANAAGVASTKLVPGLAIDQGNLAMTLDMQGFGVKGTADFDKIPLQVTFHQYFDPPPGKPLQQADLAGPIRDDQWANLGIDLFAGSKGAINATFEMVKPDKKNMRFSGTLDMTQAAVQIDRLGWKKPPASAAFFTFQADAPDGQPIKITALNLRGDQISAAGTAMMSSDLSQILALDLSPLIVGRTRADIHFSQSFGPGGALQLNATGEALDIGGFRNDAGGDPVKPDPRPQRYHIRVDRLYTGGGGEIDMAQGNATRDAQGWSDIDLRGAVGTDQKPLSIQLAPLPDGRRTLDITFEDFGAAMKGLGFTDTIEGGKLTVSGQSTVDAPRTIVATSNITAFKIRKLPALALLLNATSPFGFSGIITDSADFSRCEGAFIWQGDDLTVTKAHAAGSAVGINADGKVDLATGNADLQGTLVPFSVMNNVLNYIPVVGNIITGGKDQGVLAVAYTIKGPLAAPQISVNPISLLTPGFLRNLFFRDDIADTKTDSGKDGK